MGLVSLSALAPPFRLARHFEPLGTRQKLILSHKTIAFESGQGTLPTRAHQETMAALDSPLERGQALAIEGDFAGALEALTEATTANEKDAKAWEATAQVLLALVFGAAGFMKVTMPLSDLAGMLTWPGNVQRSNYKD